ERAGPRDDTRRPAQQPVLGAYLARALQLLVLVVIEGTVRFDTRDALALRPPQRTEPNGMAPHLDRHAVMIVVVVVVIIGAVIMAVVMAGDTVPRVVEPIRDTGIPALPHQRAPCRETVGMRLRVLQDPRGGTEVARGPRAPLQPHRERPGAAGDVTAAADPAVHALALQVEPAMQPSGGGGGDLLADDVHDPAQCIAPEEERRRAAHDLDL